MLGLLAAASMSSAFTNTLFTQTAQFAADDFGVGNFGFSVAGAVVRAGIIISLPLAFLADRVGRRRVIRIVAWAAPIVTALGALAPTFPVLVATQAVGRPLGLALDFLIAVAVAEEMPRNSRAYAVSVMAMASGLGAGIAVMALPLADIGEWGWRLVYLVTLIWLIVAVDISRRLPETVRYERPHVVNPPLDRRRFAALATVAACLNFFVAPASFFQNRYLREVRGLRRLADRVVHAHHRHAGRARPGRRRAARRHPRPPPADRGRDPDRDGADRACRSWSAARRCGWRPSAAGSSAASPTRRSPSTGPSCSRPATAAVPPVCSPPPALLGGVVGILLVGALRDAGVSYGGVIALVALGQVVVVAVVLASFPETAHLELEALNPEDAVPVGDATRADERH